MEQKLLELGAKLKALRKNKGMTLEELSYLSGIRRMTISDIEKGHNFNIQTLLALLKHLNSDIDIVSK